MRADEREQALLPLAPLRPVSAKPAEITHERAHAGRERLLGRVEHQLARHADHGQVDSVRDLRDRAVAVHTCDGSPFRFTGYAEPAKSPARMLRKSSPPIEPRRFEAPMTATERGLEERLERGPHRDVVALGSPARDRRRWARSGSRISTSPPSSGAVTAKPASRKTRSIAVVLGQHLGDELLDSGLAGCGSEPLEQARADSAPLKLVVDGEGDLRGARVAQPRPSSRAATTRSAIERPEQRATLLPVRLEHRLDELRPEHGKAVEPEIEAVLGQAGEELE